MTMAPWFRTDYWEDFRVTEEDLEFIYQLMVEREQPLSASDIAQALVRERLRREQERIEKQWKTAEALYLPKATYKVGQVLTFPALNWVQGEVIGIRPGYHPEYGEFEVIRVRLETGQEKEFAARFPNHALNQPPQLRAIPEFQPDYVLSRYGKQIVAKIEAALANEPGFIRLSNVWFRKELLIPIEEHHKILADAVLDVAGGRPLTTAEIAQHLDLPQDTPESLRLFSLAYALQQDERFDEVGYTGQVRWFLKRLEPEDIWEPPFTLRATPVAYKREDLPPEFQDLEAQLHDELAPPPSTLPEQVEEVTLALLYPHWRAGTLPLDAWTEAIFPSARTAERIYFEFVDAETGKRFPGWVVRNHRYVFGLREWYASKHVIPGARIHLSRGAQPDEVIIRVESRRPMREWIRTVRVQDERHLQIELENRPVAVGFDERMAFLVPDVEALDALWQRVQEEKRPLEDLVVHITRTLSQLTPQSQVHAVEVYAAVNLIRRVPPGPVFALLVSRPWFTYIGDLYFRMAGKE